ncbi:hypothetical protein T4B_2090 [Trichinella pseudospiralis]|uniref:Uncharacterized protein n=1 Tax=Trichinella pseudospiralis TaxID=6337 RepID=A0A0V1GE60_TRIPS|nr:hypothetical protein T4B_2090 [Trichinella pseudospiralis]
MKITQQFQVVSSCLLCLPRFAARGTNKIDSISLIPITTSLLSPGLLE